jgi:hypothetical protein
MSRSQVSYNRQSIFGHSDMAQELVKYSGELLSDEVQCIIQGRLKWRGKVQLKPDVLKVIDVIRTKIPSGTDVDGYNAVPGRYGSKQNSFGKSFSGATHTGGGGGGSRFAVLHSGPRQAKPEPAATARGPNQAHSGRHYGPATTVPASSPKSSGGAAGTNGSTWGSSKPSAAPSSSSSFTGGGAGGGARYVPLFDKGKTSKEIILDKQVRDYLNKFCEERYDLTLRQFTNFMEGDNSELLSSFMTMFFDTAVSDAIQAPHLAKLLSELCVKFPYLQTEVNKRYAEFMATFETVTETEVSSDDLDAMDKEYHTTKYRLGYTQFITELLPYKITNDEDFYMILNRLKDDLINNYKLPNKSRLIESYASSWDIITTSLVRPANEKILSTIRNKIKTEIKPIIMPLTGKDVTKTYPSLTSKARFALLDAMDRLK